MRKVDVVIPAYNYARYLKDCVDSILMQRDVDVRAIIIDDKSTDDTETVGPRIAQRDSRIVYHRHITNLGMIATLNESIFNWAAADYLVLLSADDLLAPGALARAVAVMEAHPDVGMVYGLAHMLADENDPVAVRDETNASYKVIPGETFLRRICAFWNPVPTPTAVVRTALQKQIGGYNHSFAHTSDMEMWMRFATRSSIGIVNAIQGHYRWHSSNMSKKFYNQILGDKREQFATCQCVLKNWGAGIPEFDRWVSAMEDRLGDESLQIATGLFENGSDKWRDVLAEIDEAFPRSRHSRERRKLLLKAMLGRETVRSIKRVRQLIKKKQKATATDELPWHAHGKIIGQWPEEEDINYIGL